MKNLRILLLLAITLVSANVMAQGVTTSSMSGKIVDTKGEALPGAAIVAVHTPTGTTYGNDSDFDGFFRIANMRVGGPYKITVSYIGYKKYVQENIFLTLGQTKNLNVILEETANQLDEIVITSVSDGVIDPNKTGSETTINLKKINSTPAASRSIADFVRLTPQVQISEGNDGFSISVAGQNNRYNSIYIDGAVSNDVFGLAGSGTNGGQTGVNPFSVDAIESFQVNLAPFDVKISGFTGAAISAITRSGTNEVEASVYSFVRNQSLAGKTNNVEAERRGLERERLADFSALTYGARVGGALIKDKLFYFINYERQDDEIPAPFQLGQYGGDTNTPAAVDALRNFLLNTYNYDLGRVENVASSLKSDKITARLDWNINQANKLTARYSYVGADNLEARNSGFRDLQFENGTEFFKARTNSISVEWAYQGKKTSNSLLIGYTGQRDDRDPLGDPFPSVQIGDGFDVFRGDGITFGAERFSTANLLNTDVLTVTNNFQIYSGKHTFTIGTHNEFVTAKNLFFASNYGYYRYSSVDDFINNTNLLDYDRGYSLLSPGAGDTSSGAAEFGTVQLGFYVQDDIQVTDDFKLSAGLRVDIPFWEDGIANDDFNNTVPGIIGDDALRGARVGKGVDTKLLLAPRVGFNWNVKGENKTQIRGGIGVFTSRLPLVWPGGTYNNNGVTGGFFSGDAGDGITFNPDVNNQPVGAVPGTGETGGNVDLFAPDFTLPQILKFNAILDQRLKNGWSFTIDGNYQKNLSNVLYENLNISNTPSGFIQGAGGPADRPYFNRSSSARPVSDYGLIILASNTSVGSSWNTTFTLNKNYTSEFIDVFGSASYSYGDAYAIFDGTSSQNSSQWRNIITKNGKNNAEEARSGFAQGHRVLFNTSIDFKWNDNFKTTIGLLYDGTVGQPFSYTYGGEMLNDDSRDNALFFVPERASDVNLVPYTDNGTVVTVAEQQAALDAFIDGNDYLSSRRGQYAERNGDWGKWSHIVDLRIVQDIKLKGKKNHTFQITADIFNFTNLLNKNWGVRYFGNTTSVLEVETAPADNNGLAEFTFDPSRVEQVDNLIDDRGLQSSRWQAQIGFRYTFN